MKQEEKFRTELLEMILYRQRTFIGTDASNHPYEDYATIYLDRWGNLSSHLGSPPEDEGHGEQILLIEYRCIPWVKGCTERDSINNYLSWAEGELLQEANLLLEEVMG